MKVIQTHRDPYATAVPYAIYSPKTRKWLCFSSSSLSYFPFSRGQFPLSISLTYPTFPYSSVAKSSKATTTWARIIASTSCNIWLFAYARGYICGPRTTRLITVCNNTNSSREFLSERSLFLSSPFCAKRSCHKKRDLRTAVLSRSELGSIL